MEVIFALSFAFLVASGTGSTADFWIFAAGLAAGVVIVIAIRRDLPSSERRWDGRDRRAQ